ncbi:MAG: leucine zipper domain-containing protein [Thermoanaerobaculia bacterium]
MREAADAVGLSERTAYKWLRWRYQAEGVSGLADRSSRPHRLRCKTPRRPGATVVELRRQRQSGAEDRPASACHRPRSPGSCAAIASRGSATSSPEPPRRHEKQHPGSLIHLDIKKPGRIRGVGHRITGERQHRNRGIGWEHVHVAIDDASGWPTWRSCLTSAQRRLPAFERAVAWYRAHGIEPQRLLTDNGSYRSRLLPPPARAWACAMALPGPTGRAPTARPNASFVTLLREWAHRSPTAPAAATAPAPSLRTLLQLAPRARASRATPTSQTPQP